MPDILTAAALRRSLFDASSIAYSDSASGRYVSETLFKRLDVEEASINAPMIEETPVAEIVAAREVALGFQESRRSFRSPVYSSSVVCRMSLRRSPHMLLL